jgi:chromate transporter
MREETEMQDDNALPKRSPGWVETGVTALKLGLTSFGGPVAHIGYFRDMYVRRLKWLDEATFADLTAMCQFLPGPASSQLGMAIAMRRAGPAGAIAAWAGFTLPSAILLAAFAYGFTALNASASGVIHGLKLAAVAVVAHAVWNMAKSLTPDAIRIVMALLTTGAVLLFPGAAGQLVPLVICGAAGYYLLKRPADLKPGVSDSPILNRKSAIASLLIFGILLLLLPLLSHAVPYPFLKLADIGYRAGSLVFGGGHVVLPMLERESVSSGLLTEQTFVAGYGAAQAIPGPLFTFTAFIGAASAPGAEGVLRAAVMLLAVFLPSYLLVAGALPYWDRIRSHAGARSALAGVNASVVGLLLAALYDPVWTSAVHHATDIIIAAAAFAALIYRRVPPILVVAACAAAGWLIAW